MIHRRSSSLKILAAMAALGSVLAESRPAGATVTPPSMQWVPLGTGCASAIAVGPNNVPWILGCEGGTNPYPSVPQPVYYLDPSCSELFCSPEWIYDGFSGVTLSVNLGGSPFVTDVTGTIYGDGLNWSWWQNNQGASPTVPHGAGSWGPVGAGAVSSFVVGTSSLFGGGGVSEMFGPPLSPVTVSGFGADGQLSVWGVGCGSNCATPLATNGWLYEQNVDVSVLGLSSQGWSNMGYGGAANTFALFTDTSGTQNPWVLNTEGNVFVWDGAGWFQEALPGQTGAANLSYSARSITDHFALQTYLGVVYEWTGFASGVNPGWSAYITDLDTASGFVDIIQIAYSQSIVTTTEGTVGPSQLWGIDISGNIYRAQLVSSETPY